MFVAWRDLRFARGRFALIGLVVALITVLVGFLSGLTGGLAHQNVSAVLSAPADRLVFSAPHDGSSAPTFTDSAITPEQVQRWRDTPGVSAVHPVGIAQSRAENGQTRVSVALFGVDPGYSPSAPSAAGHVGLSTPAADELGAGPGDRVSIAGRGYVVDTVSGDDWYSHTPVVTMTSSDWQSASATDTPTVLAVSGDPDWAAADARADTVSKTPLTALTALTTFRSEIGSLLLMMALLIGISALVVGAFFTVWTMQRSGDIAVLKALGASTASLAKDALGQALVVLVVGIALGVAVVVGAGLAAGTVLPFVLSPLTTVLPAGLMVLVGLAGAAFALRSVTSADPLTALGSNR